MSVDEMLKNGEIIEMNNVLKENEYVKKIIKERGDNGLCKIIIVGNGGIELWEMSIDGKN